MRKFEVSSASETDRVNRHFKLVLHEIYPEETFDDIKGVANQVNKNGLGWRRKWVEQALPTIEGAWLRAEFIDAAKVDVDGHGLVGYTEDGMPDFSAATTIGKFEKGYIDEIDDNGVTKTVLIGEGSIDNLCYPAFIDDLMQKLNDDESVYGSVEILGYGDEPEIKYEYGYHEDQRIPAVYRYSAYAILGLSAPADETARIVEVNSRKDETMEMDMNAIVSQAVAEYCQNMDNRAAEINAIQAEADAKVAEANELVTAATAARDEALAESEKIRAALEETHNEIKALNQKLDEEYATCCQLREELAKAKAKERIAEMNEAIKGFTDAEKAFAQDAIDAFIAEPLTSEINSVTSKIYEGIGKNAKLSAKNAVIETNSTETIVDIFAETASFDTTPDSIF